MVNQKIQFWAKFENNQEIYSENNCDWEKNSDIVRFFRSSIDPKKNKNIKKFKQQCKTKSTFQRLILYSLPLKRFRQKLFKLIQF